MANYQPKPDYTDEQPSAIETQTSFEDAPLAEVIDLDEARERLRGMDTTDREPKIEQPAPISERERTQLNSEKLKKHTNNVVAMRHFAVIHGGRLPSADQFRRAS